MPDRIIAQHHTQDVEESVQEWLRRAKIERDIVYFSVEVGRQLAGQIFLHDIDEQSGEGLVGYHLFQPGWRGRGVGTQALKLLQRFVAAETSLKKLILITSAGNIASRRAAEKAGFAYVGSPHEDPTGVLLTWTAPDRRERT